MASTTLSVNWTLVKFTPTGGSATTFTRVQSVGIDSGGKVLKYKGDGDKYPTGIFNVDNEPMATIECDNIAQVTSFNSGSDGAFEATLNDVKNGVTASGGAIKFALSHAVLETIPVSGSHAQFAKSTLKFHGYSADGTTSPITATAL